MAQKACGGLGGTSSSYFKYVFYICGLVASALYKALRQRRSFDRKSSWRTGRTGTSRSYSAYILCMWYQHVVNQSNTGPWQTHRPNGRTDHEDSVHFLVLDLPLVLNAVVGL